MKTDITMYGDEELSLRFSNDEALYRHLMICVKYYSFKVLREIAEEVFTYTPEQLEDLEDIYNSEVEEYHNY